MPGFKDRIGDQYGRLTVISHAGKDHKKFRKKVRNILQNLHYKSNYGYALESLTKSHIFSCLFEYSVYGLKFTSQFIKEFNNENFT